MPQGFVDTALVGWGFGMGVKCRHPRLQIILQTLCKYLTFSAQYVNQKKKKTSKPTCCVACRKYILFSRVKLIFLACNKTIIFFLLKIRKLHHDNNITILRQMVLISEVFVKNSSPGFVGLKKV